MTLNGRISKLERFVGADEDDVDEVAHWAQLFASARCNRLEEDRSPRSHDLGLNCPHHDGNNTRDHPVEEQDLDAARRLLRDFRRQGIEPSIIGLNMLVEQSD